MSARLWAGMKAFYEDKNKFEWFALGIGVGGYIVICISGAAPGWTP